MNLVCLDMEGVLTPEIWIALSEKTKIGALRRTTRDEPDYDKLMKDRIRILKEHGLKLKDIQDVISGIDLLPGAADFMDRLRRRTQVIVLSDTFEEFAMPLMEKLRYPTIFCNSLVVNGENEIVDYKMRIRNSKLATVKALQSVGFETIASGDSFNDLGMIEASKAGFLFRTTPAIRESHPEVPAFETYDELYEEIEKVL
ncbi:MAG: bifunctional phosphoserine phosphatase/homoserine phosphotransferase ThrH [Lachnospiraceae bacterium]|nr:bifunctional phosphoserine phosphatase/homoserine phosphotransferase ThrH [Lachnospiraceae bacterium]